MDSFRTSVKKTSKVAVQPTEATGPSRHLYDASWGPLTSCLGIQRALLVSQSHRGGSVGMEGGQEKKYRQ